MKWLRWFDRYAVYPESVFALSVLLFILSLLLPGIVAEPLAHKLPEVCAANYGTVDHPGCTWGVVTTYWFGIELLVAGWAQLSTFQIAAYAWLANPLFFFALLCAKKQVYREAIFTSAAAALLGLLAFMYPSLRLDVVAGDSFRFAHVFIGVIPWEASLIVLFLYARARNKEHRIAHA